MMANAPDWVEDSVSETDIAEARRLLEMTEGSPEWGEAIKRVQDDEYNPHAQEYGTEDSYEL